MEYENVPDGLLRAEIRPHSKASYRVVPSQEPHSHLLEEDLGKHFLTLRRTALMRRELSAESLRFVCLLKNGQNCFCNTYAVPSMRT